MQIFKLVGCVVSLILTLLGTCVCGRAQSVFRTGGVSTVDGKLCQRLRQDISLLVQQAHAQSSYAVFMKEIMPDWVDIFLPQVCKKQRNGATVQSPENGYFESRRTTGQLRLNNFASSKQNVLNVEKNINENRIIPSEDSVAGVNVIRKIRDTSAHERSYLHGEHSMFRVKRFLVDGFNRGTDIRGLPLKRFNPVPARQPMQFTRIMDYFIRMMSPRVTALTYDRTLPRQQGRGYADAKTNLAPMAFSNAFIRRNKREVGEKRRDKPTNMKRRTKRFLFGELAEIQPMPSMFSIMMGTARDPNTGKPIEFGGDVMRNMIVNSFTSFLPPAAQPPPGKEPNDLVQIMTPMWYFSNMQQGMRSLPSSNTRTASRKTSEQKRNQHGYYGDIVPGKRRKRSPN